jgi:hypothetical protein
VETQQKELEQNNDNISLPEQSLTKVSKS